MSPQERERHRQAAYLYSIIQSAENSEDGGPTTDVERAYDAGIMYAARAVLENWAEDNDWTEDLDEYADEIRERTVPGSQLPETERKVFEAAVRWRVAVGDEAFDEEDVGRAELALCDAVDALDPDQLEALA